MATTLDELRRTHRQLGKLLTLASSEEERRKLHEPFRLAEKALILAALEQLEGDDEVVGSLLEELSRKNDQLQGVIDDFDSAIAVLGLVTETARLAISVAALAAKV
jgi:hypothetical protein